MVRRDEDLQLDLSSLSHYYYIELSIGSPEQQVRVRADLGDYQLWVSAGCLDDLESECDPQYGTYEPTYSDSSSNQLGTEIVYYSDGNSINLTFYVDTITLSTGHYVGEVQFGVADYTDYDNGVLGLGFGESSGNTDYRNFIEQLASQEITNSKAFSLALGNLSAVDSGIIIFGGVDTKKFSGSLSANEIVPRDSNYAITMESVGVGRIGDVDVMNFTDSSTTVALESTVRMTFLPNATVTALLKYFNVTDYEDYTLSCTSVANSTSFENTPPEEDKCIFGIQTTTSGTPILGINFLRYAYVVFDQTLKTVSLAQYVNCGQNEQAMPSSGAAGFVGECAPVGYTTPATEPPSSPGTSSAALGSLGSGLSTGAKAGIGVGATVGAIALAALAYYIIAAKSRRQKANNDAAAEPQPLPQHEMHADNMTEQPRPSYSPEQIQAEQNPYVHEAPSQDVPSPVYVEITRGSWNQTQKLPGHEPQLAEMPSEMDHGVEEGDRMRPEFR
ncbi:hypothetical protein CIB48_g1844 [Xylaria polymorpha]|nr:hypothetical protein CIB48_g1844 [Xylaria polymorpha]